MKGVNKVILVGRLGQNPEGKVSPSGTVICGVSVATSESWKDKKTGEKQERTEWHRVVFFNRLAEIADQYLTKGSQVYIEGSLQTRKWQDKNGNDRYTTEIKGGDLQMLGSDPGLKRTADRGSQASASGAPSGSTPQDFEDDEIPF